MALQKPGSILLLGDPGLRIKSKPIGKEKFESEEFKTQARRLKETLEQFRADCGFGRAVSAPQLGIPDRVIAMNLGDGPFLMVNPEVTNTTSDRFTLWDDCLSFPWLMVRLERHSQIDLCFQDERGAEHSWPSPERSISELIQHEVDHLDGILAVDRALDRDSIIARSLYQERRGYFDQQVDYVIQPTI